MFRRHLPCVLCAATLCLAGACLPPATPAQATAPASPAMQLPPDQAAYQAANAILSRPERVAALQAFLKDFPKSRRVDSARQTLLELLIEQTPRDEHRIHELASAAISSAGPDARANQENNIAFLLAEAPPNGVDLRAAEGWARDAVEQTTEEKVGAQMKQSSEKYKQPPPSSADIHQYYSILQAANLQTLAEVYVHEGKLAKASAAIAQAQALNPEQGGNYVTLGQIAHAQHHDAEALDDLENAEVYGCMTPAAQTLLHSLYTAQHGNAPGALDAEIDRRYRARYKPIEPAAHTTATSGRTVLLELYTGSACEPCAGADLALDAVLNAYPRTEVVALALDQHIPGPDPLANPSSVARARYDGVHFTPTFRLDGRETRQVGGARSTTQKSYTTLAAEIDQELSVPTGATLHLTASLTPAHTISASASFQVADAEALHKLLTAPPPATKTSPAPPANAAPQAAAKPETTAPKPPSLVLNFALVQREVRYSGENGIRFHSMVVRDLAKPTADGFPVALTGSTSAAANFDPTSVSAANSKYLADFVQHNERFAAPHFLTTDTSLPLDDLAVAAWVEDLSTHRVVAAAYAPLSRNATQQAAR